MKFGSSVLVATLLSATLTLLALPAVGQVSTLDPTIANPAPVQLNDPLTQYGQYMSILTMKRRLEEQERQRNLQVLQQYEQILYGAHLVAADNTFLGSWIDGLDDDSLFFTNGLHGSKDGSQSIWNPQSSYGDPNNPLSPWDPNSPNPPIFIKDGKRIVYLTTNRGLSPSISPNLLLLRIANNTTNGQGPNSAP